MCGCWCCWACCMMMLSVDSDDDDDDEEDDFNCDWDWSADDARWRYDRRTHHIRSHRIASHHISPWTSPWLSHRSVVIVGYRIGWIRSDGMGWDEMDAMDGMGCCAMEWDRIGMRALKIAICRHFVMRERQPPTTGLVAVVVQQNYGKLFMGCLNGPATDVLLLLLLLLLLVPQLLLLLLLPWLSRL